MDINNNYYKYSFNTTCYTLNFKFKPFKISIVRIDSELFYSISDKLKVMPNDIELKISIMQQTTKQTNQI